MFRKKACSLLNSHNLYIESHFVWRVIIVWTYADPFFYYIYKLYRDSSDKKDPTKTTNSIFFEPGDFYHEKTSRVSDLKWSFILIVEISHEVYEKVDSIVQNISTSQKNWILCFSHDAVLFGTASFEGLNSTYGMFGHPKDGMRLMSQSCKDSISGKAK